MHCVFPGVFSRVANKLWAPHNSRNITTQSSAASKDFLPPQEIVREMKIPADNTISAASSMFNYTQ